MDKNRIYCQFCEWSTVRYFRKKTGGVSNTHMAYQRLKDHVLMEHESEYDEVVNNLDGIFDEHKVLTLYDENDILPPTLKETLERK